MQHATKGMQSNSGAHSEEEEEEEEGCNTSRVSKGGRHEEDQRQENSHGLGKYNSVSPITMAIMFFKSYINEANHGILKTWRRMVNVV